MQLNRKVSEIATGRWPALLAHFGVAESFLTGKHGPCPICGGKDRFRFDNKEGRGTWICSHCGSSDGFKLLELIKGWSFREAAHQVELIAGTVQTHAIRAESEDAKKMAAVKRIWEESESVSKGDPVWLYLNRRIGLDVVPSCLRYHPALAYTDGDIVEHHPAMVAAVTNAEGKGVAVHRIYLKKDGSKASVDKQKKIIAGKPISGAAVRLGRHGECLGIAEGIETALAASMRFGVVSWAAISAGMLEQWLPPEGVKKVIVFGDNDASFTGQAAAYSLAKKLRLKGVDVDVRIPEQVGKDWADE